MIQSNFKKYTLEADVDDYVKVVLSALGLKKGVDYNEKSAMSDYMKEALKGAAKTKSKKLFGIPDFHLESRKIPVVIENKLGNKYHISANKSGIKMDENSIKNYAVNGAVYYAKNMIESKKYDEVIAIGISGEDSESIKISTYYVFSSYIEPKYMKNYSSLGFLESKKSFDAFYEDATVTEDEKHRILIKTREELLRHAKNLNKLMNNHNVGVEQRVVYVSGMLLSMQDILDDEKNIIDSGLIPDDLKGIQTEEKRDGVIIMSHLKDYLSQKKISADKRSIMIDSFKMSIALDAARDIPTSVDKVVANLIDGDASITKQIFVYLYENIYTAINLSGGALDIMAEMYSTFLKYALSDGAPLGKVLTPPYITSMMAKILNVNKDSRVMDIAAGSAAFLVAAMDQMIEDANKVYGKGTKRAAEEIETIKHEKLLGVEIDAKMYTLAASNMILRGDGSTKIRKADTFSTPKEIYTEFMANVLLLNPPFSYVDNGLPFLEFGLDNMEVGGKAAVIIQDSVGAGKSIGTTANILKRHKMLASIKMTADLFMPNANVQTSIYIFEAGTPHNCEYDIVKFIDFRNDGYKRTERCIKEVDHPVERYQDIYLLYRLGFNAVKNPQFHSNLWDIDKVYCEDTITAEGNDWNFEKHVATSNVPKDISFISSVDAHLSWEIGNWISNQHNLTSTKSIDMLKKKEKQLYPVSEVFDIYKIPSYNKEHLTIPDNSDEVYDYITRTTTDRGICEKTGFIDSEGMNEAGTFSLGLLSMVFYYRENDWYAGQFMRKISCKYKIDRWMAIYLETVLNGLSEKLLSGLVRDVDSTFLDLKIELPSKDGEIDFEWISNYVKSREEQVIGDMIQAFTQEQED